MFYCTVLVWVEYNTASSGTTVSMKFDDFNRFRNVCWNTFRESFSTVKIEFYFRKTTENAVRIDNWQRTEWILPGTERSNKCAPDTFARIVDRQQQRYKTRWTGFFFFFYSIVLRRNIMRSATTVLFFYNSIDSSRQSSETHESCTRPTTTTDGRRAQHGHFWKTFVKKKKSSLSHRFPSNLK